MDASLSKHRRKTPYLQPQGRKKPCADIILSELLHQVPPHSPHACPLAIYVHRDRSQQTGNLDAPNGQKHILRAIRLQPVVEEEREHQAVEYVLREVERD